MVGGVGFIISTAAQKYVEAIDIISSRIAVLKMRFPNGRKMSIYQVYSPHSGYDEAAIETFYEELETCLEKDTAHYQIVMGDFNGELGEKQHDEKFIGKHGLGDRNDNTGARLATFCETRHLYATNTYFQKNESRRWTWEAPNARTHKEIDHILSNRLDIITDTSVITPLNIGSDHRLVRTKIHFDDRFERKLLEISSKKSKPTMLDESLLRKYLEEAEWEDKEDATEDYTAFVETFGKCVRQAEVRQSTHNDQRISRQTRELLNRRRLMPRDKEHHLEYHTLCKLIRAKLKEDHENFRTARLLRAAEERKSIKKCKRDLALYKNTIIALINQDEKRTTTTKGMERTCQTFYTNLYASAADIPDPTRNLEASEMVPAVLSSEVRYAIDTAKAGTTPGPDHITAEAIKAGGSAFHSILARKFTKYIRTGKIPQQWKESRTVLLLKKGDRERLCNYRPITLLSQVYKVFTRVILNRIATQLDEQQPIEQAGFRKNFSTIDHIHVVNQIVERCREFHYPLVLTFVDYEKAFDSVETNAVLQAILEQGVNPSYVVLLKEISTDNTTQITLFHEPIKIPVRKGVRQGDTISPKLFTACLESRFRRLDWADSGILIDGRRLNHLRFADDIVLITHTIDEAQRMLEELQHESAKIGLRINQSKTKFMRNDDAALKDFVLQQQRLEEVDEYVYLGQNVCIRHEEGRTRMAKEIGRRQKAAWSSYNSMKEILNNTKDQDIRANLFNSTVAAALLYGCETWSLTQPERKKLAVTQRAIERRMLNIRRRDIHNEKLRTITKVRDANDLAQRAKHRWAGHICRLTDYRWTRTATEWFPPRRTDAARRPLGRPPIRWSDEIRKTRGPTWMQKARCRSEWRKCCDPQPPLVT